MSDMERWRGETDARLRDAERRLDSLNGNIARGADALQQLTLGVGEFKSEVKTTVRTWGIVIAALWTVGGGVIVAYLTHT